MRVMGAGHVTAGGYRMVRAHGHANRTSADQILEHRKVMSEYIGRPLHSEEAVHHRDGCRTNNTVGPCFAKSTCECAERHNLELWSTKQPRGQRVADKLAWAWEIITLYGGAL